MINNFLFYGIGLKSSELGNDPYGSFALSALAEIAAMAIIQQVIGKILTYIH